MASIGTNSSRVAAGLQDHCPLVHTMWSRAGLEIGYYTTKAPSILMTTVFISLSVGSKVKFDVKILKFTIHITRTRARHHDRVINFRVSVKTAFTVMVKKVGPKLRDPATWLPLAVKVEFTQLRAQHFDHPCMTFPFIPPR